MQTDTEPLELIPPTSLSLNLVSQAVLPQEIDTISTQGTIRHMFKLASGKGHSKNDTRQMVGLAAPQIGILKRIISIDVTADGSNKPQNLKIFINPRLISHSTETDLGREGCWSCGNICGAVSRFRSVELEALDPSGKSFTATLQGFVARIAQHEIDHLDGIRFPDRIPLDEPEHLHYVKPEEFSSYRTDWARWQTLCPRADWEHMKSGEAIRPNE